MQKTMTEESKQIAIEFAEWLVETYNGYEYQVREQRSMSHPELFDIFLKEREGKG
jgi:hypothetical protein